MSAGRKPKIDGRKAMLGAQGLQADALTMAEAEGVKFPGTLNRYGKHAWKLTIASLVPKGNLALIDLPGLEMMCLAYQDFIEANLRIQAAEKAVPGSGNFYRTEGGYETLTADRILANRAQKEFRSWSDRFGGSPVTRIKTNGTAQGDLFDHHGKSSGDDPEDNTPETPHDPTDPYSPVQTRYTQ